MKIKLNSNDEADIIRLNELTALLYTLMSERDATDKEKEDFSFVQKFVEAEVGYLVMSSIVQN